jgi:hypothetical protein
MKIKLLLLLVICGFSCASKAVELLGIQQQINQQKLLITPRFELEVSQKVIDAIDNGIVITFVYQAKLFQSKDWWYDTLVDSETQTFEVRYFSLSKQYQLHHTNSRNKLSFITLKQLLQHMGQQTVFDFVAPNQADYLETRIFLDKQALPSIMQLPNVFDADWNLNSDWQSTLILPTKSTFE